jgi:hypothetical protein
VTDLQAFIELGHRFVGARFTWFVGYGQWHRLG